MAGLRYRERSGFAGKDSDPGQFRTVITGIAVDPDGLLYASGDSEIQVFGSDGAMRSRWHTERPALSVAVARDRRVFVGEEGQIEIFDPARKTARVWRDEKTLCRVTAIGFTGDSVLAGDAAARAIRRLDQAGRVINTIGTDNNLRGLLIPNGVVSFGVDAAGIIHVANPGKHRVERYSPDGKPMGRFGRFHFQDPAGFTGCCNPTNIAVSDRIYVTEKAGPRLKAYSHDGAFQGILAADCFDPNCKNIPVHAGPRGLVYAADTVTLRILVFEPEVA